MTTGPKRSGYFKITGEQREVGNRHARLRQAAHLYVFRDQRASVDFSALRLKAAQLSRAIDECRPPGRHLPGGGGADIVGCDEDFYIGCELADLVRDRLEIGAVLDVWFMHENQVPDRLLAALRRSAEGLTRRAPLRHGTIAQRSNFLRRSKFRGDS